MGDYPMFVFRKPAAQIEKSAMRCPSLDSASAAARRPNRLAMDGGKPRRFAATRPDGSSWPRVSIVTPSYNQGQYLEETIRSILLQGYPDLEYIVIDGGSTDESIEIIRKYEPWLAYWVSEKDRGQADAINKGSDAMRAGEIFQFINSDDFLDQEALQIVAGLMVDHDCVSGPVVEFGHGPGSNSYASTALTAINFITRPPEFFYHQPGVWVRTKQAAGIGGFDAELHYKFDWEFMLRYLDRYPKVAYTNRNLGFSRLHPASKTMTKGVRIFQRELDRARTCGRSPGFLSRRNRSFSKSSTRCGGGSGSTMPANDIPQREIMTALRLLLCGSGETDRSHRSLFPRHDTKTVANPRIKFDA